MAVISDFQAGYRSEDVNDLVELYNIWLFVENAVHDKTWTDEMLTTISGFKGYVISVFRELVKDSWTSIMELLPQGHMTGLF